MNSFPEPDTSRFQPPPAPQGGRPSLLSPELITAILHAIRTDGLSDSAAGLLAGVSTSTLSRWKQDDEDLATLLGQARAQHDVIRLRAIGEARRRDGSLDWRAQAWLLQHSSPEQYGTPSRRRQAAAQKEAASETASPLVVTPEQLMALQARRMESLTRMNANDAKPEAPTGQDVTILPETPLPAGAGDRSTDQISPALPKPDTCKNAPILPETSLSKEDPACRLERSASSHPVSAPRGPTRLQSRPARTTTIIRARDDEEERRRWTESIINAPDLPMPDDEGCEDIIPGQWAGCP